MMPGLPRAFALLVCLQLAACAATPGPLFSWGQYQESLYRRSTDPTAEGQQAAFLMVERTIKEAEARQLRVPPGVYADYGLLLFKQGRVEDAAQCFRREAETFPESEPLMQRLLSRIDGGEKGGTP